MTATLSGEVSVVRVVAVERQLYERAEPYSDVLSPQAQVRYPRNREACKTCRCDIAGKGQNRARANGSEPSHRKRNGTNRMVKLYMVVVVNKGNVRTVMFRSQSSVERILPNANIRICCTKPEWGKAFVTIR